MVRVLVNPPSVNWQDQESYLFLNPRWPQQDFSILVRATQAVLSEESCDGSFLILASSGTSQAAGANRVSLKFIKKKNFLGAAESFNSFFSLTAKDVFLRALPLFHVGGLSLYARAFLAGARVVDFQSEKWDANLLKQCLHQHQITRISLVPTQIFDVVSAGLQAPESVDTVFVGGAALAEHLRQRAVKLGWPVVSSYGMTETSSMVASQKYSDRWAEHLDSRFFPLPGVQIRVEKDHRLVLKAPGLLTYETVVDLNSPEGGETPLKIFDEGNDFFTQDFGEWDGKALRYLGRAQDLIKISGELVSLAQLRCTWDDIAGEKSMGTCLLDLPDPRCENEIVLVSSISKNTEGLKSLIEKYNERVLPFQRIRRWIPVERWPRSELGKILVNELRAEVLRDADLQKNQSSIILIR